MLLAAQHALMVPDLTDYLAEVSPSPELDGIHGTAMVRLMQWAEVCKAAAMMLVFDKYWWQNQVRQSVYRLCAACLPFNARRGDPYEVLQIDEELVSGILGDLLSEMPCKHPDLPELLLCLTSGSIFKR